MTGRTIARTLHTALLESWANRGSFWFQISIMVANDLAFVAFWFLFFDRVGQVRGWDAKQALTLLAILATVAGVALGLCANARRLGRMIGNGELDAALALPIDPLAYLLFRRVDTALLGDLLFGPALFAVFCRPTPERTLLFLLGSAFGAVVFVSFLVALGSLTFFTGGAGEEADLGFQALLIVASYPLDFFGGLTKLVVFTAVPAAFVTGVPTELVDRFSWSAAGGLAGAAAVAAALAWALFRAGLRRYSSGAAWTRA